MAALDVIGVASTASGGADNATRALTFAATPSNGELLVFFLRRSTATATVTTPGGETVLMDSTGTNRFLCVYAKVAASESSATYSFTVSTGDVRVTGYRIEGPFTDLTPLTFNDNGTTTAATSRVILNSGAVSVPANTLVLASLCNSAGGDDPSFTNSFADITKVTRVTTSGNLYTARRLYTATDSGVQTTASWATSGGTHSALLEIEAPSGGGGGGSNAPRSMFYHLQGMR